MAVVADRHGDDEVAQFGMRIANLASVCLLQWSEECVEFGKELRPRRISLGQ
jgi:hypothetical protein